MSLAMGFLLDFVALLQDGPTALCATPYAAGCVRHGVRITIFDCPRGAKLREAHASSEPPQPAMLLACAGEVQRHHEPQGSGPSQKKAFCRPKQLQHEFIIPQIVQSLHPQAEGELCSRSLAPLLPHRCEEQHKRKGHVEERPSLGRSALRSAD